MNAKNPEQRSSAVLNYDNAPTNATYEELLNQGWEHVFSFNLHQPGHWPMAQQEIDQFKNAGYLVTMVPSKDMAERNGGGKISCKKEKINHVDLRSHSKK